MGLLACLVFLSQMSFAEETVEVPKARAVYQYNINSGISFLQAKKKALELAKQEALKIAGVKELLNTTEVLSKVGDNEGKIQQLYTSFISSETKGEVLSYEILNKPVPKPVSDEIYKTEVVIKAEVIKYETQTDPSFSFEVEGLKLAYEQGEPINFKVNPDKNGYLHIFVIEQSTLAVSSFYPNEYEPSQLFNKRDTYIFPLNEALEYSLDAKEQIEKTDLLFVYTKEEYVYKGGETMDGFIKWLYTISPDKRSVKYFNVLVRR